MVHCNFKYKINAKLNPYISCFLITYEMLELLTNTILPTLKHSQSTSICIFKNDWFQAVTSSYRLRLLTATITKCFPFTLQCYIISVSRSWGDCVLYSLWGRCVRRDSVQDSWFKTSAPPQQVSGDLSDPERGMASLWCACESWPRVHLN